MRGRSAHQVFDSVTGLLNAAGLAKAQMKAANGSIDRDLATQRYAIAVDSLVEELTILKNAGALIAISEFLEQFSGVRNG